MIVKIAAILMVAGSLVLSDTHKIGRFRRPPPKGKRIQVRLSVQDQICGSLSPPYNDSYFLSNVKNGSTLFDTMIQAEVLGFSFEYENFTILGPFITTVNGLYADSKLHQFWALIDAWTGQPLPLGAGSYIPKDGDNILFKFDLF